MLINDTSDNDAQPSKPGTTIKLVILSGRSGSGKSSAAYEICHLLKGQKVPHAHIDGDNLDTFYPSNTSPDMMLQNLEGMWSMYWMKLCELGMQTSHGGTFVVVLSGTGMVLNLDSIVDVFKTVVNGKVSAMDHPSPTRIHVSPVVLEASDEAVTKRLKTREIGGELEEHLHSSSRMSRILGVTQNQGITRFVNECRDITDLASEILEHVGICIQ